MAPFPLDLVADDSIHPKLAFHGQNYENEGSYPQIELFVWTGWPQKYGKDVGKSKTKNASQLSERHFGEVPSARMMRDRPKHLDTAFFSTLR